MCPVATIMVLFVENRHVRLKFQNENGRQFRIHYVSGATDTLGGQMCVLHMHEGKKLAWGTYPLAPPPVVT